MAPRNWPFFHIICNIVSICSRARVRATCSATPWKSSVRFARNSVHIRKAGAPTRHTLFAQARSAVRCSACRMQGGGGGSGEKRYRTVGRVCTSRRFSQSARSEKRVRQSCRIRHMQPNHRRVSIPPHPTVEDRPKRGYRPRRIRQLQPNHRRISIPPHQLQIDHSRVPAYLVAIDGSYSPERHRHTEED